MCVGYKIGTFFVVILRDDTSIHTTNNCDLWTNELVSEVCIRFSIPIFPMKFHFIIEKKIVFELLRYVTLISHDFTKKSKNFDFFLLQ